MLTPEEKVRYSRQTLIPEIGKKGQEKLKKSKVLVVGAGGLGSVSAYYLAAAGIGSITIVDFEIVETSNLNRQIIHTTNDIGVLKTESAREKLERLNPNMKISTIAEKITKQNIRDIVDGVDIIVDATDNFTARRILNRASIRYNIPFVYGGVNGFTGMLSTFIPGKTPCFECVYGKTVAGDTRVGVIGPLPGIIASMQALEAVKFLLDIGTLCTDRLLYVSGMDLRIKEIAIKKDPKCGTCKKT
jgi:adenylyltransferase/sulfurtransferase